MWGGGSGEDKEAGGTGIVLVMVVGSDLRRARRISWAMLSSSMAAMQVTSERFQIAGAESRQPDGSQRGGGYNPKNRSPCIKQ